MIFGPLGNRTRLAGKSPVYKWRFEGETIFNSVGNAMLGLFAVKDGLMKATAAFPHDVHQSDSGPVSEIFLSSSPISSGWTSTLQAFGVCFGDHIDHIIATSWLVWIHEDSSEFYPVGWFILLSNVNYPWCHPNMLPWYLRLVYPLGTSSMVPPPGGSIGCEPALGGAACGKCVALGDIHWIWWIKGLLVRNFNDI